jgi:hypothetical protein
MNLILYIGLDVHNDSIAVSIAPSNATEVRRRGGPRRHARARATLHQTAAGCALGYSCRPVKQLERGQPVREFVLETARPALRLSVFAPLR